MVENDPTAALLYDKFLHASGFQVFTARTCAEAPCAGAIFAITIAWAWWGTIDEANVTSASSKSLPSAAVWVAGAAQPAVTATASTAPIHRPIGSRRNDARPMWYLFPYQGKEVVQHMHDQHGTLEVRGR